jgi:sulfur-oxidizing protein SoxX
LIVLGALATWHALASPPDVERGRAVVADARKGNCVICHAIPMAGLPPDAFGNLGPSLAGVGLRLTPEILRRRIIDPRTASPETIMPGYAVSTGLYRVQQAYAGKPILTPAEVEDVVAFLVTLK